MTAPYAVRATREGDWWFLEVGGVEGGFTQARRLDQVDAVVRDLLSLLLDLPPESFTLDIRVDWPAELRAASERASVARARADRAREVANAEVRRVTTMATDAGFTVRDVAALLDLSPQRVSQLRIAERRAEYSSTPTGSGERRQDGAKRRLRRPG